MKRDAQHSTVPNGHDADRTFGWRRGPIRRPNRRTPRHNVYLASVQTLNLEAPEGDGDRSLITMELQLDAIRHLMQRTGEPMERLGTGTGVEIGWVGWKHD